MSPVSTPERAARQDSDSINLHGAHGHGDLGDGIYVAMVQGRNGGSARAVRMTTKLTTTPSTTAVAAALRKHPHPWRQVSRSPPARVRRFSSSV